jgi:hypothetical protein
MACLADRDGKVRTRLYALWLLRSGWSVWAPADTVGTHYRSVQRYGGAWEVSDDEADSGLERPAVSGDVYPWRDL